MGGTKSSMLWSLVMFIIILSAEQIYRGKLASSELFTIIGGFINSLLFLLTLTFIGNLQEESGARTGWGAVFFAEAIALIAASTIHRVCITTWGERTGPVLEPNYEPNYGFHIYEESELVRHTVRPKPKED